MTTRHLGLIHFKGSISSNCKFMTPLCKRKKLTEYTCRYKTGGKTHYTVGKVPKSDRRIVETEVQSIPLTHKC